MLARIPSGCVILLPFLLWMVSLSNSTLAAESAVLKLETFPAAIKLQQGEQRRVMVIARNVSTNNVQLLPLDWIVTPGISAKNQTGDQFLLTPDAGVHWLMDVLRTNDSHETGQVYFRLDYKRLDAPSTNGPVNCVTTSLDIQDRQTTPLEQLLEVRIESSLKLLQQPQTGAVYVVIKNKANFPIALKSINARAPVDIILTNLSGSEVVASREEVPFQFEVSAKNKVHPGKHLLLFEVNLAWNDDGRPQTGTVLSKYEFDVGVLGDSEFLVPVGVPSFLLLPGFLILIVFAMLWNISHKEKPFPWATKSAEFWSLAVIISLLAMTIYRIWGSDLLEGYGLNDVYWVWFGSAAVGLAAWAGAYLVLYIRQLWNKHIEAGEGRKRFSTDDTPAEALRKLALNGRGILLARVKASISGQTPHAFELQPADSTHATLWIAPQIQVSFDDAPNENTKVELIGTFEKLLMNPKDAGAMASFLENEEHEWVKAGWLASGTLRGVTELPMSSKSSPDGAATGLLVMRKI
jgi:copper(I)-binding protein